MTQPVIIQTSFPDMDVANSIADAAVSRGLAACVHIMPIQSVYRWEGRVCQAEEYVLNVKTVSNKRRAIEALVDELHPYELPAFIVLEIKDGKAEYLNWIADNAS